MARSFNGTSNYLSVPINLSSYSTLTLGFWLYWNAFANDDKLAAELSVNINSNASTFIIDVDESSTGKFQFAVSGSNSMFTSCEIVRPSAAVWHQYVFTVDLSQVDTSKFTVYVDGVSTSYTQNVKNGANGTFGNYTLYFMSRAGSSLFGAGRLSDFGIWSRVLASDEALTLGTGYAPSFITNGLVFYAPLSGANTPEVDIKGNLAVTVSGASPIAHYDFIRYPGVPKNRIGRPRPFAPGIAR